MRSGAAGSAPTPLCSSAPGPIRPIPAPLCCSAPGPIRHLFVLVPCQRLCRFPHPLSITLRPRLGESLARSPPSPFPSSPMGSDTFGRGGRKGIGKKKKKKRSRGKQNVTHCLLNLYLFIPSALRFGVQQAAPRAGPGRLSALPPRALGMGGKHFHHPVEQGKGARGELLAQKFCGTDFGGCPCGAGFPEQLGTARHGRAGGNVPVPVGGEREKEKYQMVSLGTANALIKGH